MGAPTRSPTKLAAAPPWQTRSSAQHEPFPGGNSLDKHRTRYRWAYVFGAVCPERGVAVGLVMPFADTGAMNDHLAEISRTVAPGAHTVLDGAGWHGGHALIIPGNVSLVVLPPCSPELNPVENVWQYLRPNRLAISVFDDYDAIVDACCAAWNRFAENPEAVSSITSRQWLQVNP